MLRSIVLASLVGCVAPQSIVCDDGTICPNGTVCVAGPATCAVQEQIDVCIGKLEGDPCAFGMAASQCHDGVCSEVGCGNHIRDAGEACDDGNVVSGDGCRADCQKVELCNDGIVDEGERCDDKNDNPADGCDHCALTTWVATATIGTDTTPIVPLKDPQAVAVDVLGDLFIADTEHHVIRKLDPAGVLTTVAGNGISGYSGDGGPATNAQLQGPTDIAVDGLGNLYIADSRNDIIRRVDAGGIITTIAGIPGTSGNSGDGAPARAAHLSSPQGVAVDGFGNVFIADAGVADVIRRVDAMSGVISTIAGTGTGGYNGETGVATAIQLDTPQGVAVDSSGVVYIADTDNDRIRRVALDGTIATVAGSGTNGFAGDLGPAVTAWLDRPERIAFDGVGGFLIADRGNFRIRRVDSAGVITSIAGGGSGIGGIGDGLPAVNAYLYNPSGVAVFGTTIYIADSSNARIRKVESGLISTIVGTGVSGDGDEKTALATELVSPAGVTVDAAGSVYVADTNNHRVRRINADGSVTTIAGDGTGAAPLGLPSTVAMFGGALYVVSQQYGAILRVEASGALTIIAIGGIYPSALAFDATGTMFVATTRNCVVRIDAITHAVTPFAGVCGPSGGFSGDGGPATSALLDAPRAIAVDAAGDVFIADQLNHRVRRVDTAGTITTIAGGGTSTAEDVPATTARIDAPSALSFDATGRLYVGDRTGYKIRRIGATGTITTIAGTGVSGGSGDGGSPAAAQVTSPVAIAFDPDGNLVFADSTTHRVRRIANGIITTIAGRVDPVGVGPLAHAHLSDPRAFVVAPGLALFAGGGSGTVEAAIGGSLAVVAGRYPQTVETGMLARFRSRTFGPVRGVAYDAAADDVYLTANDGVYVVHRATSTIEPVAPAVAFRAPSGLFLDAAMRMLYVADTGDHVVRVIDLTTSTATTIAGMFQTRGVFGDGELATAASLNGPRAVTRCKTGDVFIADTDNHRVRRVDHATGTISTVLGVDVATSSGQGTPAASFPVDTPGGLACDDLGNLYVTSTTTVRLLDADVATGVVDGTRGVHTIYGDVRDTFPASASSCLTGIVVIDGSTVQVTDACAGLLVELRRSTTRRE